MKTYALGAAVALAMIAGQTALAESVGVHKVFLPEDIQWAPPPPGLPAGAQVAVLFGDPRSQGQFTLRIKAPKGYAIGPHTHPSPELITIISGKLSLGLGKEADRAAVRPLPAGSLSSMPQGVLHYVFVDEDTIIQLNGSGPWSIDYANPKDDPRLQIAPDTTKTH